MSRFVTQTVVAATAVTLDVAAPAARAFFPGQSFEYSIAVAVAGGAMLAVTVGGVLAAAHLRAGTGTYVHVRRTNRDTSTQTHTPTQCDINRSNIESTDNRRKQRTCTHTATHRYRHTHTDSETHTDTDTHFDQPRFCANRTHRNEQKRKGNPSNQTITHTDRE